MSEKEKDWKLEIAEIVEKQVKKVLEEKLKPQSPPSSVEPEHKHWNAEDLLTSSCPECKAEVEKIGKAIMQKSLKERKDYPFECVECGLGVKKEETECPSCGSTKAKSR